MPQQASVASLLPTSCDWCPRKCGANRAAGQRGVCGAADSLRIARAALHFWEEPPISGTSGSGTVFFSYCPLRCCYCQNKSIALGDAGADVSLERLADILLEQQDRGALNVNMVTPTHYGPIIAQAVRMARSRGLSLPVVWNTAGYENVSSLAALEHVVDVYLTDFKYASPGPAQDYSNAGDYPQVALAALDEMVRQAGAPQFDQVKGQVRLVRGVVVRHLLLPGHLDDSMQVVKLLHERYGKSVLVSLMNQYTPVLAATDAALAKHPNLGQAPSSEDYELLLDYADALGMEDYFWQDGQASRESFIPAFDLQGVLQA